MEFSNLKPIPKDATTAEVMSISAENMDIIGRNNTKTEQEKANKDLVTTGSKIA